MPTESALIFGKLIDTHVVSEEGKQDIYEAVIGMMLDVANGKLNMRPDVQEKSSSSDQQ